MIATLGGKPQIITFALDELLGQGVQIRRVCAVHVAPSDPDIQRSLALVQREFEHHRPYQARAKSGQLRFDSFAIRERPSATLAQLHTSASGRAIERIDDFTAPNAIWLTVHRLITALKREGFAIALLVTGGPRLIGLQAVSAASLLFEMHDQCWHLFTPPVLRDRAGRGERMHRADDDPPVSLVQVPLLPISMIAPNLQAAASLSPQDVLESRHRVVERQDIHRVRQVLGRLTPRQRDVLREFACDGADAQSVAKRLNVTVATLDTHKTRIYEECRIAWELPESKRLTHRFLREKFGEMSGDHGLDTLTSQHV